MNGKESYDKDFWNLSKLIAEKRTTLADGNTPPPPPPPPRPETAPMRERKITLTKINDEYKDKSQESDKTMFYRPEKLAVNEGVKSRESIACESKSPLVLSVKLVKAGGSPRIFTRTAEKYWKYDGTEVPFVDFYAFSPTYANFNVQTFKYYLWWRTNFRRQNPIKASWPYLSVYVSELINCPHLVSREECLDSLWRLFEFYADAESPLFLSDALCKLPEIICDYSLIHSMRVPESVSERTLLAAVKTARLREVFFENEDRELFCKLLISACSEYEFAKSKFASDIVTEDNEKYIKLAILECIDKAESEEMDHPFSGAIKEVTTVSRHSYSNYVYVDPEYLYVITVDYCSVNRSYTLRNSISGIVKQCENNLRTLSGIKPKLKVFSLEPIFRDTVDSFFEKLFPPEKRRKVVKRVKPEEIPEYEKYYENERVHEFSLDNAKRIEERSWQVVEKLVEAMDDDTLAAVQLPKTDISAPKISDEPRELQKFEEAREEIPPSSDELEAIFSACPDCREFILAVYDGSMSKANRIAREKGIPTEVLADTVNAAAFDVLGDVLIESYGDGIRIIEDYEYIFCKNG